MSNESQSVIANPQAFFNMNSGRWATQRLKAALMEGRALSSKALRTLDTLRRDEWKFFDDVVVEENLIRLVGVQDLISRGLTRPVPNSLGKMVYAYEQSTYLGDAEITLDGTSRTPNDKVEFQLNQGPLPIIHKDYFINLRTLSASRNLGEPLDSTQARQAARVVAEAQEKMLFQGGPSFGSLPIYGYTTFPHRHQKSFDATKSWDDTTKTGASFLADVVTAQNALVGDRQYGPYVIYVSTLAGVNLDKDFNSGTSDTRTVRQRILQIPSIQDIKVADQLPAATVVFVQMDPNNVVWTQGEPVQNVQWDEGGGFTINFKVWTIAAPLIRADAANRSGIVHFSL